MLLLSNQELADLYFTKGSLWKKSASFDGVKEVDYYVVTEVNDSYVNTLVIRTKEDKITSVSNYSLDAGVFIEQLTYCGDCSYFNESKINIAFVAKWL